MVACFCSWICNSANMSHGYSCETHRYLTMRIQGKGNSQGYVAHKTRALNKTSSAIFVLENSLRFLSNLFCKLLDADI